MTIKRKNCSPLSVALTGASSPLGEPFSAYTASGNQAFNYNCFANETARMYSNKTASGKKASPWGEVPSLSRRRGVMTIKRKNCSPLSVALAGASSPLGEPFSA